MVAGNLMSKSKLKYKEFKGIFQKFWIKKSLHENS